MTILETPSNETKEVEKHIAYVFLGNYFSEIVIKLIQKKVGRIEKIY